MSLEPDKAIDAWIIDTRILPADFLSRRIHYLSDSERRRHDAMGHRSTADMFAYGRTVTRGILGRALNIPPGSVDILIDAFKRPHLDARHAVAFNLSHSGAFLAIAIGRSIALGIDIEAFAGHGQRDRIAARFFAPDELEAYNASREQHTFFLRIWTMKEAFLKGLGIGLRLDTRSVSVLPLMERRINEGFPGWRAETIMATDISVAALAYNCTNPTVNIRHDLDVDMD